MSQPRDHRADSLKTLEFHAGDLAATETLGRELGRLLFPGSVVALAGPLGAGKTTLVRAIAEGLGVADSRMVNSPTFVLLQEYPARLPIYHFDAYRLKTIREFADLGVEEYFASDGVCLIEWADRVEAVLPPERINIRIEPVSEAERRITVEGSGDRHAAAVRELTKTVSPSG
jgi:tRNA threonylcarbamoyladenosine biosynthesis protein TsaE